MIKLNCSFFSLGCSECPRNLQYVLNGVIERFFNVTTEVEKVQIFSQVGELFEETTSRIEMANVRNADFKFVLEEEQFRSNRVIQYT